MNTCKNCGAQYEKWQPDVDTIKCPLAPRDNGLCIQCNEKAWLEWEADHADELARIKKLEADGHTAHCACRLVWGDGECECHTIKNKFDPYAWMNSLGNGGRRVSFETIVELVAAEIKRAEEKHGAFPSDVIHCAAIVGEESGELIQAAIDHVYSSPCPERLLVESVQTAAMAFRFLLSVELLNPGGLDA